MATHLIMTSITPLAKRKQVDKGRPLTRAGDLPPEKRASPSAGIRQGSTCRTLRNHQVAQAAAQVQNSAEAEDECPPQGCLVDLMVRDIMSTNVFTCRPEDTIFRAMEILVDNRVSGVPVIDAEERVVGVVSGYDLLAVESTPGMLDDSDGFFPPVGRCRELYNGSREVMWNEFKQLRATLQKSKGTTVGDVMRAPVCVSPDEDVMEASNTILRKKLHRMAVVDDTGKLMGVISRGDILRATIQNFRFFMASQDEEDHIR